MNRASRSLVALGLTLALLGEARPAPAQALYWLDTSWGVPMLSRSDANGLGVTGTTLAPGSLPEGLAVSATNGKLYWAEAAWSNANIEQTTPTLAGVVGPVVTGGSMLRGIAIDDSSRLVYWTSSNLVTGATIHRAALDGTGATTIATLGPLANPRGITVDHAGGKIYWTEFDQSAIWSANLDGSSPAIWLSLGPGSGPYGIVVDPLVHVLYWTEYNLGNVRRAPTGVPSPITIFSGQSNPTYLALDRATARLYWIDTAVGSQRLKRGSTSGSGGVLILPPTVLTYGGLAFQPNTFVEAPQPEAPRELALERAWPSPSRGAVHVSFALPRAAHARLAVLDLQGREIAVLADEDLAAGRYERTWNGEAGARSAAAGVYFARLSVEGRHFVRRLARVR